MKEQLKALYAVQEVDIRLQSARKELSALDVGGTLKQQLAAAEGQKKKLQEEVRKAEAELQDAELELKTIEQKKSTFEKKLYGGGISNPKELSSMEKEIEMLGRNRAQLDDRILKLYDTVDQHRSRLKEFEGRIAAAVQRLEQITKKYESESSRLSKEITALETERNKAIEGVEPALLRRYDNIRSRANGIAIVKVVDGKCGGCHIGLTGYTLRLLRENGELTFCENCGRMILADE